MPGANDDLAARLRAWVALHAAGGKVHLEADLEDGLVKRLLIDHAPPAAAQLDRPAAAEQWVPTDNQLAILDALEGKALKTESLVRASGVERRTLFRELPELRERGLVQSHPRLGYVRPDAPPEELRGSEA
jgi:predicted Rossmann fold nucleotide-binding protein DprA/Smf involved in DNA uptake